jgi:Ras-related protein Rab-6A
MDENDDNLPYCKIIFIGDPSVGKSSILSRFYDDKFDLEYQPTIGLDFQHKNYEINGNTIKLYLYDTAGQEKFKSLIPMYIRDANIILIVYDISVKESFTHTDQWFKETEDLKRKDAIFVLVGNKKDLEEKRQVSTKEAEDYATHNGFLFKEVSAKSGEGIEDLFYKKLFQEIDKIYFVGDTNEKDNNNEKNKCGIKINGEQEKQTQKKGGCCGIGNKNQ